MTGLAKHLASDLDIRLQCRVEGIGLESGVLSVELESGETMLPRAAILTPPVPQSLELLRDGGCTIEQKKAKLDSIDFDRCIAVMAVLTEPSRVPAPGWTAPNGGPISWVSDNYQKGVSALPAVTIHTTAAYSLEQWEGDATRTGELVLQAAEPWIGTKITEFQVHRWRYASPVGVRNDSCFVLCASPPIILAGDAFSAPRVEGAALSGWAAAEKLTELLA
jgi:predicted NAD/FAD-dependent oxidoreductase